jgi:hypothetical protein
MTTSGGNCKAIVPLRRGIAFVSREILDRRRVTELKFKIEWYDTRVPCNHYLLSQLLLFSSPSTMPRVPSTSPATGRTTCDSFIHTTAFNFVDNAGRTLLLRGVNLSGCSKFPFGRPSYILDDFWEAAEAGGESFIGQPLNLDDGSADVHLARLRGWGFNLLRFPVTWEALEHEGP